MRSQQSRRRLKMVINWEKRHEQILDELNALAGRQVQQFDRDTAHLPPPLLARARELNEENDYAVQKYYERS